MGRTMILMGFLVTGIWVSYADTIVVEREILMAGFTMLGLVAMTIPDSIETKPATAPTSAR